MIKVSTGQIVEAYSTLHSVPKVAAALGISGTTTARRLAEAGVKLDGRAKYESEARAFTPEEDLEIGRRYMAGELSADLASCYGVTIYTIKQALKRSRVALRPNPAPLATPAELERILALRQSGNSYLQIAVEIGRHQKFVSNALRKLGIVPSRARGPQHGSWKGGRSNAGVYWRIKLEPTDRYYLMANNAGYVLEHRVVLARKLGRPLRPDETVHHVNGDRKDNRPENLQLRQGRHGKGVVMRCADCGSLHVVPMEIEGDN